MCGILGYIGNIPEANRAEAFQLLSNIFIISKCRGTDASGFSAIHNVNEPKLITEKRAISSIKFVMRSNKFRALNRNMPSIFIGHTRAATSGTPDRGRNNHPFNSQRYSLVHNGGISNWQSVVTRNSLELRTETDSEVLLRLLEQKDSIEDGIQHTMHNVPMGSRVAIALLNHKEEGTLSLFKNSLNPIHILTIPEWQAMFFASTKAILDGAIVGVYGADKKLQIMAKYGMKITIFPAWELWKFGLTDSGAPKDLSKTKISMPPTNTNHRAPRSATHPKPNKSTEIVVHSAGDKEIENSSSSHLVTVEQMSKIAPETRQGIIDIAMTMEDISKVMGSLTRNRFMSEFELDHFRKWMGSV